MNKKSQLEVGDILRLNYAQIESGYASEFYGVESQNDWYEYNHYIESGIFVVIYTSVNKQLILAEPFNFDIKISQRNYHNEDFKKINSTFINKN